MCAQILLYFNFWCRKYTKITSYIIISVFIRKHYGDRNEIVATLWRLIIVNAEFGSCHLFFGMWKNVDVDYFSLCWRLEGDFLVSNAICERWLTKTMNNVAISLHTALEMANLIFLFVDKELTLWPMSASLLAKCQWPYSFQVLEDDIIFEATITFSEVIACILPRKSYIADSCVRLVFVSFYLATAFVVIKATSEEIALFRFGIEGKPGTRFTINFLTKPLTFSCIGNVINGLN